MLIHLAAFVIVAAGIMAAKSLIVPFLLAIFLAIICAPPLYWMRSKGVPSILSIILLLLILLSVEIFVAGLIGSSLAEFTRSLPSYQAKLRQLIDAMISWLESHGIEVTKDIVMDQFNPGKLMSIFANMLGSLTGILTNTFMISLTLVFILLEATGFPDKLRAMLGDRNATLDEYAHIMRGVNKYLALKTLTSLITGLLVMLLLQLIQVDFAVMWGMVAFLFNFIPTIGSIIAAIPAVLLALVQLGPGPAVGVAVGYLTINILIGNLLEPRIMGSGVGLSALVVFTSMVFWGWLLGPVGMLLSVPLTMTCKIALEKHEDTRWLSILLGSNREAARHLREVKKKDA
jgi:predicted PurR-regulated permease PerM